jgi:hypothetical protein
MARDEFFDRLRTASRALAASRATNGQEVKIDPDLASTWHSANLWLTPSSVEGFNPAEFKDLPARERDELVGEVAAFLAIATQARQANPATKAQINQGRKHLERIVHIVGRHVLKEWLEAQQRMLDVATAAATAKGWYVEKDEKQLLESLLGDYKAPRLRIRTPNNEVVLDPIARFGGGRQGIVDLVVMPTYETVYLVAFKDGNWQIIAPHGTLHKRPFSQTTLVNTISHLPKR